MYAVFQCGGAQHKASIGDQFNVQKLAGDVGQKVEIDAVLLVKKDDGTLVGKPYVTGAKVFVEIVKHGRDKKIMVQKFKRRIKYRRRNGHRQPYTCIKVTDVVVP